MKKRISQYTQELKLPFIREHHQALADEAARGNQSHTDYLQTLLEGESALRQDRRVARRIKDARFPALKTLEDFDWSWPKKIPRAQIQELLGLAFLKDHANVIFLGGVGLGKTHLALALGYTACLQGHRVAFATAVDIINTLAAAQKAQQLPRVLKRYLSPELLVIDELGYLPIDKAGADLLFQVISGRYERGSIAITTNEPFKKWPRIFGNDSTLASAVLDRLLHHAHALTLTGKSYRMKGRLPEPE